MCACSYLYREYLNSLSAALSQSFDQARQWGLRQSVSDQPSITYLSLTSALTALTNSGILTLLFVDVHGSLKPAKDFPDVTAMQEFVAVILIFIINFMQKDLSLRVKRQYADLSQLWDSTEHREGERIVRLRTLGNGTISAGLKCGFFVLSISDRFVKGLVAYILTLCTLRQTDMPQWRIALSIISGVVAYFSLISILFKLISSAD